MTDMTSLDAPDLELWMGTEDLDADLGGEPVGVLPEYEAAENTFDEAGFAGFAATQALSAAQANSILRSLGFRVRTTAESRQVVRAFQQGWNLGTRLVVDGNVGPRTSLALNVSATRRRQGRPTASANFSFYEFACQCRGRYSNCRTILLRRELLQSLEKYRAAARGAVSITSGYRCPSHNNAVGGASRSQHLYGTAADIPRALTLAQVRNLRTFAGIGYARSDGRVRHVDRRDLSPYPGGRTPASPAEWAYSS